MMKRTITLLLAIGLAVGTVCSACAAGYENLWDKLYQQVFMGSGLKLELAFDSEGSSLLKAFGIDMDGVDGALTYLHNKRNHNRYELKLDLLKGEEPLENMTIAGDDETHLLTAGWLEKPVMIGREILAALVSSGSDEKIIAESLFNGEDEDWQARVAAAGDAYRLEMETWLADYAAISDVVDGAMTIQYAIPAEAIKTQIKSLYEKLMQDEAMLELLAEKLSEDMMLRYLDPKWASQYAGILESMPLEGEIIITQVQSVMGELKSTQLSLPIPATMSDLGNRFTLQVDDLNWHVGLAGEANTFVFTWNKQAGANTAAGQLTIDLKEADLKAEVGFDFTWEKNEWYDEKNREHETILAKLTLTNLQADDAEYLAFEPITLTYQDELRSTNTNTSATYLDSTVTLAMGSGVDTLTVSGKSAAEWELAQLDKSQAKPLNTLDELIQQVLEGLAALFQLN